MRRHPERRRGNTIVEFTLVGIPLIFFLMGTFEMARGMWIYHTVAYAAKEGTRFAMVHGENCSTSPNDCAISVGTVARRIGRSAVGLDPALMNVRFISSSGATITCRLNNCVNDTTLWPPAGENKREMDIEIRATYPFQSVAAMFWPGSADVSLLGTYNMPGTSREKIQF
jgi:Flp pilus assembly protein TadG